MVSHFSFVITEVKKYIRYLILPLFLVLRMLSVFYVCCINSSALLPRFSWKQTILTQWSSLFWIHIFCSVGYLRAKADEEQTRAADDKKNDWRAKGLTLKAPIKNITHSDILCDIKINKKLDIL